MGIARHPNRPTFLNHVFNITDKFIDIHWFLCAEWYQVVAICMATYNGEEKQSTDELHHVMANLGKKQTDEEVDEMMERLWGDDFINFNTKIWAQRDAGGHIMT